MSDDWNIRAFYKEHQKNEDAAFRQSTGLSIRRSFQQYSEGSGGQEVFLLKLNYRRKCIGVELQQSISYLLPVNQQEALLFVFDDSLMPIIEVLSNFSEHRIKVYAKYVPSLINAFSYASQGLFSNVSIFVEEKKLCFAKIINYPLIEKVADADIITPELIKEIICLVEYRNICEEEVISFKGFSSKEEKEIIAKEVFSIIKKGLRIIRFTDYISSIS